MSQRGRLRIYLGAAPGVGKTYHMLDEAQRRAERGGDVVVGFVETYDRAHTAAMLDGLEVVPRRRMAYRGAEFEEMDLEAVLDRHPAVVLVDELAHTNVPGSRNAKRWQDVEDLLAAGIDVVTTVNVQHLESLNDVVQKITGVPQRETVPDEVVRAADQIELIDQAPEALRRRMAHGNIYKPEKIDAALSNYFRPGNLGALRELALLWVAGRVDEALQRYRGQHGIDKVWETRERVVVALTGGPEGTTLIRRAARIAQRLGAKGSDLLAVHVARSDGLTGASPAMLAEQRVLVESLGGTFHSVVGDDVPEALLQFARAENSTQLVVGVSRRGRLERFLNGGYGIGETVVQKSGDIDVHMVTHERSAADRGRWGWIKRVVRQPETGPRWWGPVAGLVVPILLTLVLANLRSQLHLTNQVLIFLAGVVAVARLGGLLSAFFASLTASLLLNYYFISPFYRLTINDPQNIVALVVFALVALIVASVVDFASRQERRAAKATAEAETLSELARSVLRGDEAIAALLARFRETFGMESVTLLERAEPDTPLLPDEPDDPEAWRMVAATAGSGALPCRAPAEGDVVVPAGPDAMLVLRGRTLPASDQHVLTAFAAQAAVALERSKLARQAAEAVPLAAADKMRTALLAAVSHDLRTPLSAAKLSVASLRDTSVQWSEEDRSELLAGAEESLDRLSRLVDNLLDMSRLQAGALNLDLEDVAVQDVAAMALDSLGTDRSRVEFRDLGGVPDVVADPVLLERAVANLIGNALKHGSLDAPVLISASELAGRVELRVADRGPGIRHQDWERIFTPFQRLGDRDNTTGVGLGLALSRGLVEAMGGTLTPEETPGGGMTMVVSLPAAQADAEDADEAGGGDDAGEASPISVGTGMNGNREQTTTTAAGAEEPTR
ncbi:MAG: sensor histidine kinase KdpD [Catenulispora sp.]|nr:sensor histidine kinase KdpD [Catenulispora sp.]